MSIPASTIVFVVPGVLTAGGNPLALNGLILSNSANLPVGAPVSFPSLASVLAYFGQYAWSGTATCSANTLTIVSTTSGVLAVGQQIQGLLAVGVPPGSTITAFGTYTTLSGVGTVTISGPGFTQATASAMTSNSLEYNMASVYFNGFTNSSVKPTALLFSRYSNFAISAFLRSGSLANVTPATVSSFSGSGSMSVTIDGSLKTSAAINLTTAVSGNVITWSTVASLLVTALSLTAGQITYNSLLNALVVNSTTTGATSTITFASGTVATALGLNAAPAMLSQGSAAMSPATFMTALAVYTQNWAAFTTAFEPVLTDKVAFATWNAATGGQYVYSAYDSDATIVSSNASTSCLAYTTNHSSLGGTIVSYQDPLAAAFVLGFIASINYSATNGRAAIAFKAGTGITPTVNDPVSYANALANFTNFFGSWATANSTFQVYYNGDISGVYNWLDSYVNAIWLNAALQLALVTMFLNIPTIPYTPAGYAMIEAACAGPIAQALNAGVINTGVTLTALQASQVNSAAGLTIDPTLATRGYYLQVLQATPTQRNNRTSPPCTLWYMDGGSVNQINLASIDIQ